MTTFHHNDNDFFIFLFLFLMLRPDRKYSFMKITRSKPDRKFFFIYLLLFLWRQGKAESLKVTEKTILRKKSCYIKLIFDK